MFLLAGAALALGCGDGSNPGTGAPPDAAPAVDVARADIPGASDVSTDSAVDAPTDSPRGVDVSFDAALADVFSPDVGMDTGVTARDTGVTADAVGTDVATGPGPYPPGPYGNTEGAILANLSWEGYVNPTGTVVSTTLPYGPTSLQALRGTGRGYAMVHLSEFY